jgi:hypothetical protein
MIAAALASLALVGWAPDGVAADTFADARAAQVSWAVRTPAGFWARDPDRPVRSLSLVKAVLLVATLRDARDRPLTAAERRDLLPMIRESSNAAASRVVARLGRSRVDAAARAGGLRRFRLAEHWGTTPTTTREQTRFWLSVDTSMPARHRAYGMRLLRTVKQRWGIGELALPGWSVAFKGGWTDRVPLSEHQSALLVAGPDRIAVSVLTTGEPGHAYARRTLRGVFARLLRGR